MVMQVSSSNFNNDNNNRFQKVSEGLDILIEMFKAAGQKQIFPRRIMTEQYSYQFPVYSKEEALKFFAQAEFKNCRINAYPYYEVKHVKQVPNIILIDLDMNKKLKTGRRIVNQYLKNTLDNIKLFSSGVMTAPYLILWTGNGYHVYLVFSLAEPLENIEQFADNKTKKSQSSLCALRRLDYQEIKQIVQITPHLRRVYCEFLIV
jgi:hypothetical protein